MKKTLSIVIPAHNEELSITKTVNAFHEKLDKSEIPHEILVVNDNSSDGTEKILNDLKSNIKELRYVNNTPPNGFGFAVKCGLKNFSGDYVAIVMADLSDNPDDLVEMYKLAIEKDLDAVFGSRFTKKSKVKNYPQFKLVINRIINNLIRVLFFMKYNDTTNAFKLYKKSTIEGISPIISYHFNLTVELPLKTIIRGYSYGVVPTDWYGREEGVSKLKLKEMGSRYLFTILYCLVEKLFSRGDYKKKS